VAPSPPGSERSTTNSDRKPRPLVALYDSGEVTVCARLGKRIGNQNPPTFEVEPTFRLLDHSTLVRDGTSIYIVQLRLQLAREPSPLDLQDLLARPAAPEPSAAPPPSQNR
jgi:hypothetical protein